MQIEEIFGLDNPEVSTPQVRLLGDISSHPEIERTSWRKSAPNPIHDLITIYDDEESLEVSLVTLVQITEEKEPEKASSPVPNAQIQSLPQNDQEVKSVLEIEILNGTGTQVDSLKDEIGLGEQEEEVPQREINISTFDYQVSVELAPDASILVGTLPPNEQQTKAEPLKQME
jgi:hypothetical protein